MTASIIIPGALRQYTGGVDKITTNANTVRSALKELITSYPAVTKYLYTDGERLRSFVNIYLNDEDVRYMKGEDTEVKDGDAIMIVPSVAGGLTPESNMSPP